MDLFRAAGVDLRDGARGAKRQSSSRAVVAPLFAAKAVEKALTLTAFNPTQENIKRWRVEPEGLFLINIPKGKVKIDDYPAIRDHLSPLREALEKRATQQEWFELQQAQLAYQPQMMSPKLVYPEFSQGRKFAMELQGAFLNNKCFFLPPDYFLLAYLNSHAIWFWIFGESSPLRGGM